MNPRLIPGLGLIRSARDEFSGATLNIVRQRCLTSKKAI
jgi:hypothetical protein